MGLVYGGCVPLLRWRAQCPARVFAALAAEWSWGRCLGVRPPPPRRSSSYTVLAKCVAGCPIGVSLVLDYWHAIPCGLRVPRSRSGVPRRMVFVWWCALALASPALPFCRSVCPPPPPALRTHCATSLCAAVVGPFHVVRAPLRFLFGFLGEQWSSNRSIAGIGRDRSYAIAFLMPMSPYIAAEQSCASKPSWAFACFVG